MENVTFQIDLAAFEAGAPNNGVIRRTGMLFRAGEYLDKNFSATADDLRAMVTSFAPAPVNLEHTRIQSLDRRLGRLEHVWLSPDGNELHGRVAVPTALEALTGGTAGSGVSLEFDRGTKRIVGIALTANPRVDGAAVFSQEKPMSEKKSPISRLLSALGITGADEAAAEKALAEFTATDEAKPEPVAEDPRIVQMSAQMAAQSAEIAALKAQNAATQSASIKAQAESLASGYIAAGKALPAEKPAMVALFTQSLTDDAANAAVVTFGEGKTGSRTDGLKFIYESRQPHGLFGEQIPAEGGTVVEFASGKGMSEDRKKELDMMVAKGKAPKAAKGA